jgi:hypothetical protein
LTAIITSGSIGKLLKDNIDTTISSRLSSTGYTAPDNIDIAMIKADVENMTTGLPAIKTAVASIPNNPLLTTDNRLDNLNATISSRSTQSSVDGIISTLSGLISGIWSAGTRTLTNFGTLSSDIWSAGTRTLTGFGSLVSDITISVWSGFGALTADIVTGVWTSGTRTLTGFGTLIADISSAIWGAVSRTLTSAPGPSAADIWAYMTRTLTSGGGGGGITPADVWDEARAVRLLAFCERIKLTDIVYNSNGDIISGTLKTYASDVDILSDTPLAQYQMVGNYNGLQLTNYQVKKT